MSTGNNFFTFDDGCYCHHCCKCSCRRHHNCCNSCWFCNDSNWNSNWGKGCDCHKKKNPSKPPHPQPEKICDCKSSGIQVAILGSEAPIIEVDENIKFDTILHNIGDDITYDEATGEFTIKKAGNYKISWQIIVGGSDTTRFVNFGVKLNGEAYHDFALPVTAGLLTSDLILTTKKPNGVLVLYNNTKDKVRLSRHLPNANLVITTI